MDEFLTCYNSTSTSTAQTLSYGTCVLILSVPGVYSDDCCGGGKASAGAAATGAAGAHPDHMRVGGAWSGTRQSCSCQVPPTVSLNQPLRGQTLHHSAVLPCYGRDLLGKQAECETQQGSGHACNGTPGSVPNISNMAPSVLTCIKPHLSTNLTRATATKLNT